MRQIILLATCFFISGTQVFAQNKAEQKYSERSAEVQLEVWDGSDKAFDVKEVPAKYDKESAVVIAKSYTITNSRKRKLKFNGMMAAALNQYTYLNTYRAKVLIKDKSALEDFSSIQYNKIVDETYKVGLAKIINTNKIYIGVKLLKPNGKEILINIKEEEVLTKNTDKNKEGKLAIPDLQIGDIIDYYIRTEEIVQDMPGSTEIKGPDVYFLGGEYPIMYYHVKYALDKKCGIDLISANGIKAMAEGNDKDDVVIEFTQRDIPAVTSTFWTNQYRQIPYHLLKYGFPYSGLSASKGEVKTGPFTEKFKKQIKNNFINVIYYNQVDETPKNYVKKLLKDKLDTKDIPEDSLVNTLYNYYKWQQYRSFIDLDMTNDRNYENMSWFKMALSFSETLRDYGIDNDIVISCNRYYNTLNEVFGTDDLQTFVKINGTGKLKWVCFNDYFQNAGQLSAIYQGENALILTRQGKDRKPKYEDNETPIKLPVTTAEDNKSTEKITVEFDKANLQLINIKRLCSETGAMKQDDQKKLMLPEDVESTFASLVDKKKNIEYIQENKRTASKADEIQTALNKVRKTQKDYFKADIIYNYEQDPKELKSFKIVNTGLSISKPAFEYVTDFTMENFVKKAGNNYIFEVGKLMGTYNKVTEKERVRTLDVYMPCARTLAYDFVVTIPDGYTVKGINELNKKVENECASFASTASISGNSLKVNVIRIYKNNFEPAANWPKLLVAMDAAADFTGSKILLEKNK